MSEMAQADAELAYRYLNDAARLDVETEAYDAVLSAWQDGRPDDFQTLEDAHGSDESAFVWEGIYFETSPEHGGDLVPITGVSHNEESDLYDLATEFGRDYLDAIRDEIRSMQETTDYSPREFVALVLEAAENTPEEVAHREMDISLGNYRGKKGDVAGKLGTAEETVRVTERIRT